MIIRLMLYFIAALTTIIVHAETTVLEQIEDVGLNRLQDGQQAQAKVDEFVEQERKLVDEYQAQLKLVEGLETYIGLLDKQLLAQNQEISTLKASISDVAVIERQILPLMLRMIDTLEVFVDLDVPFLLQERHERIDSLRSLLDRSDVTVAEKTRRVFEAYQIESEYGRTIEAYTAKLDLPEKTYDAEFLRIGRLGLLYTVIGSDQHGYWDKTSQEWQALENSPWSRLIKTGLRVAHQEVAPQLIHFPLDPATGVVQ